MILKNNKYTSDITEFLVNLKQNNPELESDQRKKRGELWDRPLKNKTNENLIRLKHKIKILQDLGGFVGEGNRDRADGRERFKLVLQCFNGRIPHDIAGERAAER